MTTEERVEALMRDKMQQLRTEGWCCGPSMEYLPEANTTVMRGFYVNPGPKLLEDA